MLGHIYTLHFINNLIVTPIEPNNNSLAFKQSVTFMSQYSCQT